MTYDPELIDRLVREARDPTMKCTACCGYGYTIRNCPDSGDLTDPCDVCNVTGLQSIANQPAMADQLEAARREVERMRDELDHTTAVDGDHLSKASRRMVDTVMSERDALREKLRTLTTRPLMTQVYLPMDCPVCGRHRVEWNGSVLRCEKCTTSSEFDGFTIDVYRAAKGNRP